MQHIVTDTDTATAVIVDRHRHPVTTRRVFFDLDTLADHLALVHWQRSESGNFSDDYLEGFADVVESINDSITLNLHNDEMGN